MGKPKIRFEGYSEDWEQRKLSDYLSVSGQKNRDEKYDKEDVLSVSGDYGIVNQIEFQGRSFAGASVTNYGVVETNDVVYTKSPLKANPYGIIKSNKGKPGIVSTLYAVYHPNDITDSEFVQVYFEQDARMNSYMHPLVNKGAKNDMKVSAENALKGEVIFPKLDEQRQISDYFRRLDTIITLHQRKCDEIKTLKKYMLQKMFSQNGEKVPEIRFNGFTEDWEQRKLGEVLKLENGYAFKSQFFSDNETNIIVATPGNVSVDGGFIEEGGKYYKIDGEIPDAYIFHPGDLFVTMTDLTPTANTLGKPATVPDNGVMYLHNQRLGKLIGFEGDKAFLYSLLCTSEYHNYMVVTASGSTVRHSSPGRILEYEIAIPGLDEQIKIGKYFSNLDHLITLHQRKCNELKEIKKYMLQNMFV